MPDGSEIRVVLNGLEIVDKSLLSHSLNGNVVKASSEATVPEAIFKGLSAVEAIETTPQAELLEPSHV